MPILRKRSPFLGTPYYMAPEQAAGEHALTSGPDIYSLGAILFHLLTGQPPFHGDNAMEVLRDAAERSTPRPRALNHHVPRDLETICLKCLEKNPRPVITLRPTWRMISIAFLLAAPFSPAAPIRSRTPGAGRGVIHRSPVLARPRRSRSFRCFSFCDWHHRKKQQDSTKIHRRSAVRKSERKQR